jgi:hypothetical protein
MNEPTVSSCCYAETIATREPNPDAISGFTVMHECKACGSACTLTWPPCPLGICDGSGEVVNWAHDYDTHQDYPDGTKDCPHLTT